MKWKNLAQRGPSRDLPINLNDITDAMLNIAKAPYSEPVKVFGLNQLSDDMGLNIIIVDATESAGKSFKSRGALNKLMAEAKKYGLDEQEPTAASAGNHAQGIALAMSYLGKKGLVGEGKKFMKAKIFMPKETPEVKINAVKKLGGEFVDIVLTGANFDEAKAASENHIEENFKNALRVHPFDDLHVIAGQGALMLEALAIMNLREENSKDYLNMLAKKSHKYKGLNKIDIKSLDIKPDVILVPCGGGGLVAGCAVAMNELSPKTKVVAVEPIYIPSATLAMYAGKPVKADRSPKFVDERKILVATGIAVEQIGDKTFDIMNKLKVNTKTVTHNMMNWVTSKLAEDGHPGKSQETSGLEDLSRQAMERLSKTDGRVVESAGAAAIAGLLNMSKEEIQELKYKKNQENLLESLKTDDPDKKAEIMAKRPTVVCVLTGANIDKSQLEKMHQYRKEESKDFPKRYTIGYEHKEVELTRA